MAVGFLDVPDPARYPFIEAVFDRQRCTAAVDGSRFVGTHASFTTNVTLPGGVATAANAVSGVTVLPTHRGQSILRSAMSADLDEAKDRGEALAVLFASEFSIYARFGFGVVTEAINLAIDTVGIDFRAGRGKVTSPRVELVDAADAVEMCEPVYEAMRRDRAGAIDRALEKWQQTFGLMTVPEQWKWKGHVAITRDDQGVVDGYVQYKGTADWSSGRPSSTLIVDELIAATPSAHLRLLEYLCTMAWVSKVTIDNCPVDDSSHLFLVDERRVARSHRIDQLWARVLDVAQVLTARSYEGADRLTIEVMDEGTGGRGGFAAGRYALDAGPEGASCERSSLAADVTIGASELAGIVFGGMSFAALARAGRADEHTAGSALRVDRLFRTNLAPWNPTHF